MHNTILIIEDDFAASALLKIQVDRLGYDCIMMPEGGQALEWLQRDKPRMILVDLLLPGVDGFQVLEGARQLYDPDDVPVLVLSALEAAIRQPWLLWEAGANGLLPKPYTPRDFQGTIEALLHPDARYRPYNDVTTLKRSAHGAYLFMDPVRELAC